MSDKNKKKEPSILKNTAIGAAIGATPGTLYGATVPVSVLKEKRLYDKLDKELADAGFKVKTNKPNINLLTGDASQKVRGKMRQWSDTLNAPRSVVRARPEHRLRWLLGKDYKKIQKLKNPKIKALITEIKSSAKFRQGRGFIPLAASALGALGITAGAATGAVVGGYKKYKHNKDMKKTASFLEGFQKVATTLTEAGVGGLLGAGVLALSKHRYDKHKQQQKDLKHYKSLINKEDGVEKSAAKLTDLSKGILIGAGLGATLGAVNPRIFKPREDGMPMGLGERMAKGAVGGGLSGAIFHKSLVDVKKKFIK